MTAFDPKRTPASFRKRTSPGMDLCRVPCQYYWPCYTEAAKKDSSPNKSVRKPTSLCLLDIMKTIKLVALFMLFFAALPTAMAAQPSNVSMIQLIAAPEKYQGKRVRLLAFLRIEFEGNAVYLHKEDYEQAIYSNGLWIDLPKGTSSGRGLTNQYVLVEGVFDGTRHGHLGLWSGTITDVTTLEPWRP